MEPGRTPPLGSATVVFVVDNDGGRQPMVRGDWVVTYNGEIYNFELKDRPGKTVRLVVDTDFIGRWTYGTRPSHRPGNRRRWNGTRLILARNRYGKTRSLGKAEPGRLGSILSPSDRPRTPVLDPRLRLFFS